MKVLRTPDHRFKNLKDFPFEPNYTNIKDKSGVELRIHHLDEGPKDGPIVLLMHGQPVSVSYKHLTLPTNREV